jgi:hypothetical protein
MKLRVLDLCCGTKSLYGALLEMYGADGFEYTSLDFDPRFRPTHCADIRTWDYKTALFGQHFDVVWASPPCTHYSFAKTIGRRDFETADGIVKSCLEIIRYLQPSRWFLENPGTGHLHRRAFMADYLAQRHSVCYCRYGTPYKKLTHIWTNRDDLNLLVCNKATPCEHKRLTGTHPMTCQAGSRVSHEQGGVRKEVAYEIPIGLLRELFRGEEQLSNE